MLNRYIPIAIAAVLALGACSTFNAPYDGKPLLAEMPGWERDANTWVNENILGPVFGLIGGP